jgi:hypothetical protein
MSDRSAAGRTGRARGRQRERAVAALMRSEGWIVGDTSRTEGGGDLIASKGIGTYADLAATKLVSHRTEVRLVEVKSTVRPFSHFGPAARESMKAVADLAGATAWLAHWPKNGELRWIPESEWPGA